MSSRLDKYKAKRDFEVTPEPVSASIKKEDALLYGMQKHDASRLHYDLRIEWDGVMLSWAIPKGPSLDPAEKRLAVHTEDHPIDYTHFEGIIPKGEYGAGKIIVWDIGTWRPLEPVEDGLKEGVLKLEIFGQRLRGTWALVRLKKDEDNWIFFKERDAFAVSGDGEGLVNRYTDSVLSQQAAKSTLEPFKFRPQLASVVDRPPAGPTWIHEVKFDGYRILVWKRNGKVVMVSRNGLDWTEKFAGLAKEFGAILPDGTAIDGEVVVLDDHGRSSFGRLQSWLSEGGAVDPMYFAFDLVEKGGRDMTAMPLLQRKIELEELLAEIPESDSVRYSEHLVGHGQKFLTEACKAGLEGIISKMASAPYSQCRTKQWLKSKCSKREEFVIGGFTAPSGERSGFGALLVGQNSAAGRLEYCGRVGTGFDDAMLANLHARMLKLKVDDCPFHPAPAPTKDKITWVKPMLVAEVRYAERTEAGSLRHPSFLGLRDDKDVKDVMPESKQTVTIPIKLTKPDKVFFPGIGLTKGGLAEYYVRVADRILPLIKDRPIAVLRCPDGTQGECFVQKHLSQGMPPELAQAIPGDDEETIRVRDVKDLLQLVQYGCVEIHTWGTHFQNIENPDLLVFDLDPSPDVEFATTKEAALVLREYLKACGMESFVKTTGGKGFHIAVAVSPGCSWTVLKSAAKRAAEDLDSLVPGKFVTNMSKAKRKGRIFIDYLRNGRGATFVAPYSVRAREGAPVSVPIAWDDLPLLKTPGQYTVVNLEEWTAAIGTDPWHGMKGAAVEITDESFQ